MQAENRKVSTLETLGGSISQAITFITTLAGTVITAQGSMTLPSSLVDASHKPAMLKTGFALADVMRPFGRPAGGIGDGLHVTQTRRSAGTWCVGET